MSEDQFCPEEPSLVVKTRNTSREELLGLLLEQYMLLRNVSIQCVAHHCILEEDYVEGMLQGTIAEELIRDQSLKDLAIYLNVNEDIFRIALGRERLDVHKDLTLDIGVDPFKEFDAPKTAMLILAGDIEVKSNENRTHPKKVKRKEKNFQTDRPYIDRLNQVFE